MNSRISLFPAAVLVGITALLSLSSPVFSSESLRDYWTVDQYLEEFPKQQQLTKSFSAVVREQVVPGSQTSQDKVNILIVYPGEQVSDYWRRSIAAFEARMKELKIDYNLTSYFSKPGVDELQKQAAQIRGALQPSTDYFIFTLDALRHRGMIEKVMARGNIKIILQNITTPIRALRNSQPFLYVGFDHGIGTKMLVERYLEKTGGNANYALFYGSRGYVSSIRGGTFLDEMAQHPGMILKASYYVNFDRQKSYRAAKQVLNDHPDLNFIYSSSTDIALGVLDAVKEMDLQGKVMTNGWGGGSAELEAISNGELDFTVMRINDDNGVAMAEAIKLDMQDKGASVPTIYSGDFVLVDQETTTEQLMELKKRAFRYSN